MTERSSITVSKKFRNEIKELMAKYQMGNGKWDINQQEFLRIVFDFWKKNENLRG